MLGRWFRDPIVAEWWREEAQMSEQAIRDKWLPRINGHDKVRGFVMCVDSSDIGYIQTYRVCDQEADVQRAIGVENAAGVDILIGEPEYQHRGIGPQVLRDFVRDVVFAEADIQTCIIDPETTNTAAISAYEKVGFGHVKTFSMPDSDEINYLMRLDRTDAWPSPGRPPDSNQRTTG